MTGSMGKLDNFGENIGFVTVVSPPGIGIIGGFLVLNSAGRPLEFHCTAPVKPSRAQEILYGETLNPFIYGEQIAQILIARSKTPVLFVLTDTPDVLTLQNGIDTPVLFVFDEKNHCRKFSNFSENNLESNSSESDSEISEELNDSLKSFGIAVPESRIRLEKQYADFRIPSVPGLDVSRWKETKIGTRMVALPVSNNSDNSSEWSESLSRFALTIDLAEPFTRIRLAIDEAQKAA